MGIGQDGALTLTIAERPRPIICQVAAVGAGGAPVLDVGAPGAAVMVTGEF